MARGLLYGIAGYRLMIGSWLPPVCRFEPTCSRYAELAIRRYGAWKGSGKALRRLARCHPFHRGGFDPLD